MSSSESPARHLVAVLSHPEEVRTAFPWAATLARQWRLPLTLLHVIDPVTSRELAENARAMAEDMLALLAAAPPASGLVVTPVVETGMPEAIIPAFAKRAPGGVFVLAAGEHGAFARALLRRGRDNVIHHLGSPLVVLPARTGPPQDIQRAVAGVDGSDIAVQALAAARELLRETPVVEVEVVEPGSMPVTDYLALRPAVSPPRIRMRGRAGVALLAAARAHGAGLIVVGRHGTTGLFGQHLGGTAEWLSHNADRPVLIVPPAPGRAPGSQAPAV